MSAGTMAITMAGRGARFVAAGYDMPKYEIVVHGRNLFDWSMQGLACFKDAGWTFSFAARAGVEARPFLIQQCSALGIGIGDVLELDTITDGQATTALQLAEIAAPDTPFAVFNIDTYLQPGAVTPWDRAECDGIVPCFPGVGDGWSFARINAQGFATELREKERISGHASVGFYGFHSATAYREVYAQHFAEGKGKAHGERYIAPMYNTMIAAGDHISVPLLEYADVTVLGTPEEIREFAVRSVGMNPDRSA